MCRGENNYTFRCDMLEIETSGEAVKVDGDMRS
nr:MAG TPA: hypothetical protein [Caudoviricetes sp.]